MNSKLCLIFLITSLLSCRKSAESSEDTLSGTWQSSAYGYLDNNGHQKWEPEHVSSPPILTFSTAGRGTFGAGVAAGTYYEKLTDSQLRFHDDSGHKSVRTYELSENELEIDGDCANFCGEKYVR